MDPQPSIPTIEAESRRGAAALWLSRKIQAREGLGGRDLALID
jgi:hypothetical protein